MAPEMAKFGAYEKFRRRLIDSLLFSGVNDV